VPVTPLQKRISELCTSVVMTDDLEQFTQLALELRLALREQVEVLRSMVDEAKETIARLPAESGRELIPERVKERRKPGRESVPVGTPRK